MGIIFDMIERIIEQHDVMNPLLLSLGSDQTSIPYVSTWHDQDLIAVVPLRNFADSFTGEKRPWYQCSCHYLSHQGKFWLYSS